MLTKTEPSEMKQASLGWLLGRCLIFCFKVIKVLGNSPEHKDLVNEARGLLQRWKVEKKIKGA